MDSALDPMDAPAEIAEAAIREVDVLSSKVEAACELEKGEGLHALVEVLRYLHLVARSNERLTPSIRVDQAWHELILCTRTYAEICNRYFGRFIHHSPGGDDRDHRAAFTRTLQLYVAHFGPPPSRFWAASSMASECGSCDTPSNQD